MSHVCRPPPIVSGYKANMLSELLTTPERRLVELLARLGFKIPVIFGERDFVSIVTVQESLCKQFSDETNGKPDLGRRTKLFADTGGPFPQVGSSIVSGLRGARFGHAKSSLYSRDRVAAFTPLNPGARPRLQ